MKYALVFALLAVVVALQLPNLPHWSLRIPLSWVVVSFALVSLAYACNCPRLFGKRADGRRRWLIRAALLPYELLSAGIWQLAVRLSTEPPWHRIDEQLVIGRRLRRHEIPEHIDGVLDLTCEFSENPLLRCKHYRCLPLLDALAGDHRQVQEAVADVADWPGTTYIHCAQGHGRTGMVAAMVLARRKGISASDALALLCRIRPGIGLSQQQQAALLRMGEKEKSADTLIS